MVICSQNPRSSAIQKLPQTAHNVGGNLLRFVAPEVTRHGQHQSITDGVVGDLDVQQEFFAVDCVYADDWSC